MERYVQLRLRPRGCEHSQCEARVTGVAGRRLQRPTACAKDMKGRRLCSKDPRNKKGGNSYVAHQRPLRRSHSLRILVHNQMCNYYTSTREYFTQRTSGKQQRTHSSWPGHHLLAQSSSARAMAWHLVAAPIITQPTRRHNGFSTSTR